MTENPTQHILYKELQDAAKTKDTIATNDKLIAFYRHFECYEPKQIITLVKEAGVYEELLFPQDFIDFKKIEKIALAINETGFFFSFNMLYEFYSSQVNTNVMRRLQFRNNNYLDKTKDEKYKYLTELRLLIENTQRRIKYDSKTKNLDGFARLVRKADDLFDKTIFSQDIYFGKKQRISSIIKRSINDVAPLGQNNAITFFDTVRLAHYLIDFPKTRREILFAFEPVFREMFENNHSGILARDTFEELKSSQYDRRYYKYYLARIKSLIGY